MSNFNSLLQPQLIGGKWLTEYPNLMEILFNYTVKNLDKPLISNFYGDRNAWLDFFDILNSKTITTSIDMPTSIHMLLSCDTQRNVGYED